MAHETLQTVELQRSVRYARILIGGAVLGGLVAALVTLLFPIEEGALYTMGQVVGFMLLVGGIIGLALGAILSLVLTVIARRRRGSGVISVEEVVDAGDPVAAADPVDAADAVADTAGSDASEPGSERPDPPAARAE